MADVTVGGETFKIAVDGDETLPVLLLCHPVGADLRIWDTQVTEFNKHFRVIRYDSRGHGGSTLGPTPYSMTRLGLDALAILDTLEVEKAHVLGMSMGGAVAQWLLIHAPHRVERAVLANTAAQFGLAASWNERIQSVQDGGMGGLCAPMMERWFSDATLAEGTAAESIRQTFLHTEPAGYAATCAALRDMDLREALRHVEHPVLIIAGRDDPSVKPAQTEFLTQAIAGAKLVTLPGRHISSVDDPSGFTKAVLDFLTAKAPARRAPRRSPLSLPVARRPPARRTAVLRGPAAARPAAAKPDRAAPAKRVAPKARAVAPKARTIEKRPLPRTRPTKVATAAPTRKSPVKAAPRKVAVAASVRRKTAVKPAAAPSPAKKSATRAPTAKAPAHKVARPKAAVAKKAALAGKAALPKKTAAKSAAKSPPASRSAAAKPATTRKVGTTKPASRPASRSSSRRKL